jgi:hypothetical protein
VNRYRKPPQLRIRNPAYRPAFERLDDSLENSSGLSREEKIRLTHRTYFGDVNQPQPSGKVIIPK